MQVLFSCLQFQSTRPRGARRRPGLSSFRLLSFNPRAHAGRDALTRTHFDALPQFQSTRPRGARLYQLIDPAFSHDVSIHAPTRGATEHNQVRLGQLAFQSTRPRGARRPLASLQATGQSFNPRAHAGRDGKSEAKNKLHPSFNPRAHAGRDVASEATTSRFCSFNPRAHAGRDPRRCPQGRLIHCFNPRAHAGRDPTGC